MLMRDKTNAVQRGISADDGVTGEVIDELALDLSDTELLSMAKTWENAYNKYYGPIKKRQEANKKYYLGRQNQSQNALDAAPIPDNMLFEATETFLAQALARNPDPVVFSDNTEMGNIESRSIRTMLVALADALVLRQKMKMMVRHWNVYFIGIIKHGWDNHIHEIMSEVRNPQNFLWDPNGYVDAHGDFIGYVGEKITAPASTLIEMYPEKKELISAMVENKLGTDVTWTEWWTDEFTFTTMKGMVLDKSMNPHFNYPKETPDAVGDQVVETLKEGNNHFAKPRKPYTFLSVFSFQEQPHDETSLIEQNRATQDYIVETSKQIARNLRRSNNSIVFNEAAGYTQQTARQSADGIEDGNPVMEPTPNGVRRLEMATVSDAFFKDFSQRVESLRSIYGTLGATAVKQDEETTARGMILNQQRAADRIGGTIGDALNQVASSTFNHWVQLMHVYYTESHTAAVMGKLQAVEQASIMAEGISRRVIVTSAPDSTKPKDSITEANQALALFEAGLPVDPKTVLQLMDTPDVDKTVEGGLLFKTNIQAYIASNFPDLAMKLGMGPTAPAQAPPPGQPGPNIVSPIQPQNLSAPPNNPSLKQVPIKSKNLPK